MRKIDTSNSLETLLESLSWIDLKTCSKAKLVYKNVHWDMRSSFKTWNWKLKVVIKFIRLNMISSLRMLHFSNIKMKRCKHKSRCWTVWSDELDCELIQNTNNWWITFTRPSWASCLCPSFCLSLRINHVSCRSFRNAMYTKYCTRTFWSAVSITNLGVLFVFLLL